MISRGRNGRATATAVALLILAAGTGAAAEQPPRTAEAVVVWQQQEAGGDWEIYYSVMGRPVSSASPAQLAWWTPGGSPSARLSAAALAGEDENPSVAIVPVTRPGLGVALPQSMPGALAVWQHRSAGRQDIAWSHLTEAGWSDAGFIPRSGDDFDPSVALDVDGRGLAVWVNRSSGHAELVSSVWDGATWTPPVPVPGSAGASLPEIAFLDAAAPAGATGHRAIVAFSAPAGSDVFRTHSALWDGSGWAAAAPVPLNTAQAADLPSHGMADYDEPLGAYDRITVVPASGGGAIVQWGGQRWRHNRWSLTSVQGARMDSSGAWTPMSFDEGSGGQVSCSSSHTPAATMTSGRDVTTMFSTHFAVDYARSAGSSPAGTGHAYETNRADHRAVVAPLADRLVAVSWGQTFRDDPVYPDGVISWSLGTLRPATRDAEPLVTWSEPADLFVPGDARYPDIASTVGGTRTPLAVTVSGRAATAVSSGAALGPDTGERSSPGDASEQTVEEAFASGPHPMIQVSGVSARSLRSEETSTSIFEAERLTILMTPLIEIRGIRVVARAGCGRGTAAWTSIESIQIGGEEIFLDARQNTAVPLGAYTLRVNQQTFTPWSAEARGLRLTGPGLDLVVGHVTATVAGCVGSGSPAGGAGGHEH